MQLAGHSSATEMSGAATPAALAAGLLAALATPCVYAQCVKPPAPAASDASASSGSVAGSTSGAAGFAVGGAAESECCGGAGAEAAGGCCGGGGGGETTAEASGGGCGCASQPESSDGSEGERGMEIESKRTVTVLHASLTGTAKGYATDLAAKINADAGFDAVSRDLGEYSDSAGADIEDQLQAERIVVFVLSTYEGGVAPGRSSGFVHWLTDFSNDFRVNKTCLAGVRFAVFGCGNSDYDKNFNAVAKAVTNAMLLLGGQQLCERGEGDDSYNMGVHYAAWERSLLSALDTTPADKRGASLAARRAEAAGKHPAVGKRATRRGKKGKKGGVEGEVRLPLKEYRRQKRLAKEKAEAERLAAEGYGSSSAEDSGGSGACACACRRAGC